MRSIAACVYKSIPGYPGYRACSNGWIESCWRKGPNTVQTFVWHRMKGNLVGPYHTVKVKKDGGEKVFRGVHHLICLAFNGPCPDGKECAHLDGNGKNNHSSNLTWKTPKENSADQARHGTQVRGETVGNSKLTEPVIREIRKQCTALGNYQTVANAFGLHRSTVRAIARYERWSHVD